MRLMTAMALAVLAACATAPRGAAGLEGTYRLDRVNGRPLPTQAGGEEGVMLHEGTLALQPGSRYALRMVAAVPGEPSPRTEEVAGSYRVFGDSLAMVPDAEEEPEEVRFRYSLQGTALRLHDELDHEYTFLRQ